MEIAMIAIYMSLPAIAALIGGIYLGMRLQSKRTKQAQEELMNKSQ